MPQKQTDPELVARTISWLNYIFLPSFVVIGALLLIGGDDHLTAPGWIHADNIPGGSGVWAFTMIALGILGCASLFMDFSKGLGRRLMFISYGLAGLWFFVLGVYFAISSIQDDDGNYSSPFTWWLLAVIFSHRAIVYSEVLGKDDVDE